MQCKTRGWLRKMRELGLGRQGFGGWMSGSELVVQRVNLRESAVIHEQRSFGHGKNNAVQEKHGLVHGKKNAVQEKHGLVQGNISVVQKNNVYVFLPRKAAVEIPPHSPIASLEADLWELRKQLVIQIAKRRSGKVRLQDVAAECNVNIRIAAEWLKRLSREGMISLVAGKRNVMVYSVKDVGRVHN